MDGMSTSRAIGTRDGEKGHDVSSFPSRFPPCLPLPPHLSLLFFSCLLGDRKNAVSANMQKEMVVCGSGYRCYHHAAASSLSSSPPSLETEFSFELVFVFVTSRRAHRLVEEWEE